MVSGVAATYREAWDWELEQAEFFDEQDYSAMARVVVIGRPPARDLFGEANPVGETIRILNGNYQIKGVLQAKGAGPNGGDMYNRIRPPDLDDFRVVTPAAISDLAQTASGTLNTVLR